MNFIFLLFEYITRFLSKSSEEGKLLELLTKFSTYQIFEDYLLYLSTRA